MVQSRRRGRARKVPAAAGNVERRPARDEGASTADPGEALPCPPAAPSRREGPQRGGGWAAGPDDVHLWLGAYVLEALDATDTRTVQEHLCDCWACRAELAELAVLPELLGRVTADEVIADPSAD